MQVMAFIFRIALAAVAFLFLFVLWAWVPYVSNPPQDINATVVSVFLGNAKPIGWVRDLLLLSRALLGLLVTLHILIPGLRFFFEFRAEMYRNTVSIILAGVMVIVFFTALIVHQIYYI